MSRLPRGGRVDKPSAEKNVSNFLFSQELTGDRNWSDMLGHFVGHLGHFGWSFGVVGSRLLSKRVPSAEKTVSKLSYTRELTGDRNWSDMLGHFVGHLGHFVVHLGSLGHDGQHASAVEFSFGQLPIYTRYMKKGLLTFLENFSRCTT